MHDLCYNLQCMHMCFVLCSVWLACCKLKPLGVNMAFREQAAVLAAAWANNTKLKALGAQHSLCVISGKQLTRGH